MALVLDRPLGRKSITFMELSELANAPWLQVEKIDHPSSVARRREYTSSTDDR